MHAANRTFLDCSGEVYIFDVSVSKNLFHLPFTEPAGKGPTVIKEGISLYNIETRDWGFGDG